MKKIKLSSKIIGLNIFYTLMLVGLSLYAIFQTNNIGDELHEIAHEDIPLTQVYTKVVEHQLQQAILFEKALRLKLEGNEYELMQIEEQFTELAEKVDDEIKEASSLLSSSVEHAHNANSSEQFKSFLKTNKEISILHGEYEQHVFKIFAEINKIPAVKKDTTHKSLDAAVHQVEEEEHRLDEAIEGILSKVEKFTGNSVSKAEQHDKSLFRTILIFGTLAITLGLFFGLIITITTTREVNNVVDSIKNSMNEYKGISKQVSRNSEILADETNKQAAALEETSAAVESLVALSDGNINNSETINGFINNISNTVKTTEKSIERINDSSENIDVKLKQVVEILEAYNEQNVQLNLLSLNASAEAGRSKDANGVSIFTNEIQTIVKENISTVRNINQFNNFVFSPFFSKKQVTDKVSSELSKLLPNLTSLKTLSDNNSISSKEQTHSLNEINISAGMLNEVTAEVSVSSEENAELSQNMLKISESLNESVNELVTITSGVATLVASDMLANENIHGMEMNTTNTTSGSDEMEAEAVDLN